MRQFFEEQISAVKPKSRKRYKCSICNQEGHNSRRCENMVADIESETNPVKSGRYLVGNCLLRVLGLSESYESFLGDDDSAST